MIPALWIVISTVCLIQPQYRDANGIHAWAVKGAQDLCYQQARIETTMPTPKPGETVYRVVPETNKSMEELAEESSKKADEDAVVISHEHYWRNYTPEVQEWQKCYCGKKRHKVKTEKWVDE